LDWRAYRLTAPHGVPDDVGALLPVSELEQVPRRLEDLDVEIEALMLLFGGMSPSGVARLVAPRSHGVARLVASRLRTDRSTVR
jgi:hypothetical protein